MGAVDIFYVIRNAYNIWSRTKISEKFLIILEGYQNIRKFKNIESTKISENWTPEYQNVRKILGTTIIENSPVNCKK